MSVEAITLGCRLNFAESETLKKRFAATDGDTLIVNSCAVTNEAVRQTAQAIRRARRERPAARIVVAGCAVQLEPQRFAAMPEVDAVETRDFAAPLATAAGYRARVRSFVAVQTGCDHRCTFCSIWQARGPSRSLPFPAILDAVRSELDSSAREIVLTGVDITDYQGGLGRLCQALLAAEPRLQRLRLSSLDSVEIDDALLELVAGEPRLMPHFHLSLQHGDDLILKRMKRRHLRRDAVRLVERIKTARPDATIGADLIAGFPTESEAAFASLVSLLDECDVIAAHVFPFSARPDTPAARMPQLPRETVKARAAELRARAAERRSSWLDGLVGTTVHGLIENREKGHSDTFAPILVSGSARGDMGAIQLTGRTADHLIGQFA
ncbi:radical SAM protein [Sphingomonas ginkgonis]|uniref:Radical SAM protein n=1 Tax=Sphingomonas ginkgonis TaxID=2315330 RepID=A0A429V9V2_9SPHN|nr:radical SAM protein [Sphingomonas ginkgonis]RST30749.1 radical SAM protein [Sphingomonas ginkgonis]